MMMQVLFFSRTKRIFFYREKTSAAKKKTRKQKEKEREKRTLGEGDREKKKCANREKFFLELK